MEKTVLKVERIFKVELEVKLGDTVSMMGVQSIKGKVTHIFNEGHQIIVDDKHVCYTTYIKEINGVSVDNIEGKMERI